MTPDTRQTLTDLIAVFLNDTPWDSSMDASEAGLELALAVQTALAEPETVWVLTIDHSYGYDAFVYRTEAAAMADVAGFVAEWWDDEMRDGQEDGGPEMPDDPIQAITDYFDKTENESFSLTSTEIA